MRTTLIWAAFLASFLSLLRPVSASDASLDAPPANLKPAPVHLAALLAAHDAAVGVRTAGIADTVVEDWRFTDSGISGTEHLERAGTDYHSKLLEGPFVEEYGQHNGERWHRDYNGFVSPTTTIDETSFIAERVLEDAADPKDDASVLGVTQSTNPAYVVQVKIPGDLHPEWVFYEVSTSQIVRVEQVEGTHRLVNTYDDFRATDGVTSAWHIHDSDGRTQLDDDWVRTSMAIGGHVDQTQFAQPPSAPHTASYQQGFQVPVTMYDDGTIIIRVTVNGRGLDMMLDTATPENIIDEQVARELGLPTYGHVDRLSNGDNVAFETTIPLCSIGNTTTTNLAVDAEPFNFQWTEHTKVVGVLGYDFLAGNVFKIDYWNGTLSLIAPSAFASENPVPGGITVPIELDNGTPFIQLGIGNSVSTNAVLANESDRTIVFGNFVNAHNDDFTNYGDGKHHQDQVPFADNGSFGRTIEAWAALADHLRFGSGDYQQVLVVASSYPLHYSPDRAVDAMLGFDVLRFFDLYIDYPHNRFIVKPNQLFFKVFHRNTNV
jgi:hypothetical protein